MPGDKAEHSSGILLLPSHLFFVRSVELPAGISAEELPSFVELSLEQISPFALNQLYHGYYLPAGASRVLIFAGYRKQLAVFENEVWTEANLVLPDFAAVLGVAHEGPTLAFLQSDEALTAVYWSSASSVPDRVVSRRIGETVDPLLPERARDELRRKLGPISDDAETLLLSDPKGSFQDRNLVFALGREDETKKATGEIARPLFLSMDIRDKDFLQASRRIQRQNRWLWTGVLAVFAAFLALAVFEAALFAGARILNTREARLKSLEPDVARIQQEQELAIRLEELRGERLLPFEMLSYLNQYRPPSVYYTRVSTDGLRSFKIEALTPKSQDVDRFQRLLEGADALEAVEIRDLRLRAQDGRSSFTLAGTFREGVLGRFSAPSEPENAVPELEVPERDDPAATDLPPQTDSPPETPAEDLPLGDVSAGESLGEEEYEVEEAIPLPDLPVGDAPVGSPLMEEYRPGEEPPAGEEPVPLPDLPLGEVPAGETEERRPPSFADEEDEL